LTASQANNVTMVGGAIVAVSGKGIWEARAQWREKPLKGKVRMHTCTKRKS
jgi:hypothetical protein